MRSRASWLDGIVVPLSCLSRRRCVVARTARCVMAGLGPTSAHAGAAVTVGVKPLLGEGVSRDRNRRCDHRRRSRGAGCGGDAAGRRQRALSCWRPPAGSAAAPGPIIPRRSAASGSTWARCGSMTRSTIRWFPIARAAGDTLLRSDQIRQERTFIGDRSGDRR